MDLLDQWCVSLRAKLFVQILEQGISLIIHAIGSISKVGISLSDRRLGVFGVNISGVIGFISAMTVLIVAVLTATESKGIFLNAHAILIVFGGTLAATLLCFPMSNMIVLIKVFFQKILGKYNQKHELVINEIVDLARGYRDDPQYLEQKVTAIQTPFLKEAIALSVEGGINPKEVDHILQKRALTHFKRYEDEAGLFKVISRFPPAFGLMGTTLGMIALLQGMGSPDSFKTLGPAMAIGLVATFYGIAVANLIFIPMGENLSKLNKEDEVHREIVMDGLKQIRRKVHPLVVEEHLKSYLLPTERDKMKKAA